MTNTYKVAAVQMDVAIGEIGKNLSQIRSKLHEIRDITQVFLCVFPECALCGYCFDSLEEARQAAVDPAGAEINQIAKWCRETETHAVLGFLERDADRVFNSAALIRTTGEIDVYRKVHLPYLGVDRFTTPGNRAFEIETLNDLNVGLNICYDCSFPEATRVLALQGADLVVLPTNWPPGASGTADYLPNARALENNIFYLAANRVGSERGFEFIGKSKICHPDGYDLAFANHNHEEILIAEIDPAIARNKRLVRVPGKHEIDRFADRRPEMYGTISR